LRQTAPTDQQRHQAYFIMISDYKFKEKHNQKTVSVAANATIVCGHTVDRYVSFGAGNPG